MPDFNEVLAAAIDDMVENGFDSQERVDRWMRALRTAAEQSLMKPESLEQMLRDGLAQVYRKMVDQDGFMKFNPGVERFIKERVRPALRAELDRRIMASASLIRLNRDTAVDNTLRRFQGWSTSIPPGGVSGETKREVKTIVRKSLGQLPFEERRVLIDQGHKLAAAINEIIATDGGAIAGRWRSHWRQPGYNYRPDHKERDEQVYLVRDSWAHRAGLVKKGKVGYYDDVTAVGQEPFCRCFMVWLYALRELPDNMITTKGHDTLTRVRGNEEVRAARFGFADGANNVAAGVMHLGKRGSGTDPACGRRASMTMDRVRFSALPDDAKCKRCAEKLAKWDEIRARTGRADAEDLPELVPVIGAEAMHRRLDRLRAQADALESAGGLIVHVTGSLNARQ